MSALYWARRAFRFPGEDAITQGELCLRGGYHGAHDSRDADAEPNNRALAQMAVWTTASARRDAALKAGRRPSWVQSACAERVSIAYGGGAESSVGAG